MANPTVGNPIAAAAEALKSGKDIEQAVYGTPGNSASEPENNAVYPEERPEIQVEEVGAAPAVEAKEEPSKEPAPKVANKNAAPKAENKDAQKPTADKAKQYEQGMRKFQAERDRTVAQMTALQKEHTELKTHWESLEKAFSEGGIQGVINTIAGDPKAYDAHVQREFEKREAYRQATPTQRKEMDMQTELEKERLERRKLEDRVKKSEERTNQTLHETEKKELQSVVNPLFEKYRFTGKLGDEESEYYYDKALWRETIDNLDALPEDQITRDTIEGEFKKVASAYRKVINRQVETKTKQVINQKKANAQESAAVSAMGGMQNSAAADEFRKDIRSGNITGAFKQLLSGKIRLT